MAHVANMLSGQLKMKRVTTKYVFLKPHSIQPFIEIALIDTEETDEIQLLYDLLTTTVIIQWAALKSLTGRIRCHVSACFMCIQTSIKHIS